MSWKFIKKNKNAQPDSVATVSESPSPIAQPEISGLNGDAVTNATLTSVASNVPGDSITNTAKGGILVLTLHEARGLSLPEEHQNVFLSQLATDRTGPGKELEFGNLESPSMASQPATSSTLSSSRSHTAVGSGFKRIPRVNGRVPAKYMPYALVDFDKVQVFINSVGGDPENPFWAGPNTQYKFDVSRVAELTVQLFIRNPHSKPGSGRSQDIFLGVAHLDPRLKPGKPANMTACSGETDREQYPGFASTQWVDVQSGTGKFRLGVEIVQNQPGKLSIDNFELLKLVGRGSFGKVMQVRKKDTNRIYAIKIIRKAKIISLSEVTHTLAERSILAQINNPFIVPLKFAFQSPEKLYFVLAFVNGGELFYHLSNEGRFDVSRSRLYIAEILCALECLHGFNVIYRDLKPENILLDYQGHIALCDFGLCKLEMKDEDRTNTFCGTPEYLAPELLLAQDYNKTVDWWTLGVLLYEMLTGLPPFYDKVVNDMYRKILHEPLHFPDEDVVPPVARDLLTKLLNRNPAERLGANGSAEIKSHPFFDPIDWRKLLQRKYDPAFKPHVVDALDTTHFPPDVTSEIPQESLEYENVLSQTMQGPFTGFSYNSALPGLHDAAGSITGPSVIK